MSTQQTSSRKHLKLTDEEVNAKAQLSAIAIYRLLWVLTTLTILVILYLASSLILPVVVAALLALFSSPLVAGLRKCHLPQPLASAMVVIGLSLLSAFIVVMLASPAAEWMERLPSIGNKLTVQVQEASDSFNNFKDSVLPSNQKDGEDESLHSAVNESMIALASVLAQNTVLAAVQLVMVVVITYFFLVYGHDLLRHIIRLFPTTEEKKNLLRMFEQLRAELSRYVLTISAINLCLGFATFILLSLAGVKDPLLWGALAAILNFAPYVGPMIMAFILLLVGFSEFQEFPLALLPSGGFLCLNLIESQGITPMALGRNFNMNPLLVVIWMLIWGWIWGAIGVLIAIPLLVILKILAQRLGYFSALTELLGGGSVSSTKNLEKVSQSS